MIPQVREQFGRDEEVLSGVLLASGLDQSVVYKPLRTGVHSLNENDCERDVGIGGQTMKLT